MKMTKKAAFGVVAALAAAAIIIVAISAPKPVGAGGPGKPGGPGKLGFPGAEPAGPKAVRATPAAIMTLRPYVDSGGDVEAAVNVAVFPDIGGRVAELKVAVGDRVSKGEAIALIDPSKPGSSYSLSQVSSPIAGTVTAVLVDPGETVSMGTAMAKVGVIDDLEIRVNLPERYSNQVRAGMAATVSLEAIPGESLRATVARTSPVLDPDTRTRLSTLRLDRPDARVAAGMYASVRLYTAPLQDRIVIPADAVMTRDETSFVYVVGQADGKQKAERRTVTIGAEVDGRAEALSGVSVGDLVVTEGQDQLADGNEVNLVDGAAR